jgi:tetratricopeptide (TPR) repeat protein
MSTIDEKGNASEKIVTFVQNKRKPLLISFGVILFAGLCVIAALGILDYLRKDAIAAVSEFNSRYEVLRVDINNESKAEELNALVEDLSAFARKNWGLAGGKGWALIASIHDDKKEWAEAEQAWSKAAATAKKTYFEPVALFHAGKAAEEQGNTEDAIGYFEKSASFSFPDAARAQFTVGRLEEQRNNTEAALEAYRTLVSNFTTETTWVNMARTRIITLGLRQ